MKKIFSHIGARIAPLAVLSLILTAAILYQNGVYEIAFITRSDNYSGQDSQGTDTPTTPVFSDGAVENTDAPAVSDSVLDSLNSSTNISTNTGDGTDSTDTERPEFSLSGKYESFSPVSDFTSNGYSISYKDFTSNTVLAEITLADDIKLPSTLYGSNKITVEFTSERENADAIPYSVREFSSAASMAVELYMGYILIDNGTVLNIYSSEGMPLGSFARTYVTPAYTRDPENNPLFFVIEEGFDKYFRLDPQTKQFTEAVYDDECDNRGLYFDYSPDYGTSDNEYNRYSAIVSCIVQMTLDEAHDYTEAPTAPSDTETDPPADTDTDTTPSDTETDTTPADTETDTDTTPSDTDTDTTPSDTDTDTTPADTETDTDTGTDSAPSTGSDTTSPDTDAPSTGSDTASDTATPVTDAETPGTDTAASTVARALARAPRTEILFASASIAELLSANNASTTTKYSNYTISEDGKSVYVEIMERRWAYGTSNYMLSDEYLNAPDDSKLAEHFKYYHLYNFKGGLCATVNREGRLSFRDTSGNELISRVQEYYGQNNRKLLTSYAEPLLKGIDSVGSLYLDEGYVMVRQVDIDSQFTDKLSGDYTYLVDATGNKFTIPSGYDLLAYSDGILLLERDGYYGYYSVEGKWIAQPIFTYARPFSEGLGVIGFSGSKKGIVDREGNLIVPFKYDYISNVSSGVISVYNDDGWKILAKLDK